MSWSMARSCWRTASRPVPPPAEPCGEDELAVAATKSTGSSGRPFRISASRLEAATRWVRRDVDLSQNCRRRSLGTKENTVDDGHRILDRIARPPGGQRPGPHAPAQEPDHRGLLAGRGAVVLAGAAAGTRGLPRRSA